MSDPLYDLIQDIQHNGLRWGIIFTLYAVYRKERRNFILNKRDEALFHNLKVIMDERGIGDQWKNGPKHNSKPDLQNLRRFFLLSPRVTKHQKRRAIQMKDYLKKLGSRKFQAYLLITITNMTMLVGYLLNVADMQAKLDVWMPVINLLVQAVTTIVYQLVQGSVDKEAQKQQVYVVPAADPTPPVDVVEFEAQVEAVNAELNRCLNLIKTHDFADAPAEAIRLYTRIHEMIKGNAQ